MPVHAVTTTVEIVNPLDGTNSFNFTSPPKSVGDTFAVNLTIRNVVTLGSWQARITWDPLLLTFVNLTLPTDHVFAGKSPIQAPTDSSVPGTVLCGAAAGPGAGTFTGDGTLAVMNLRIVQGVSSNGTRQVHCNIFYDSIGSDTFVLNGDGFDISFVPVNGYYSCTAPPPPSATLYVNPPKVIDPSLIAGSYLNLSLKIANATNVGTWAVSIFYDNSILSIENESSIIRGSFLDTFNSTLSVSISQTYNSTHGLVQLGGVFSSPAYGDGTMVIIVFKVLALGETAITLTDVILQDASGLPLPFTTANGYFNNVLLAKLSIDPDLITGPSYIPGTTFAINVTLSGFENLKTCIFNLTYNPLVIQEIAISTPSVLGQNPIKKLQVDDGNGYIWTNLTYRNGISSVSQVTVMTVEFQVLAMGISPINLTETQLFDTSGSPIVHETHDGLFIGLIRDVAVVNVTTDLQIAYQGWRVYVNITVKNNGNVSETFDTHFYYDGNLGGTTTVTGLVPEEERVMTIAWNTSLVQPCHNYTISATADPVPFEMNLGDNNFTDGNVKIRIMGDVNGDGTVNMRDINQLILVFRTYPGRPAWDPLNDLDRNGIIDMRDITICILNFGKTCL
jgi:hypothetical protein